MNPRLHPPARLAHSALRAHGDRRLAELASAGHDDAFETLVRRHRRALVRHCARMLGEADAEEAVQEALLKAHAALGRGHSVQNAEAWLHAIAHNSALNMLRARTTRVQTTTTNGDWWTSIAGGSDPTEPRQELREVIAAVRSLPGRQRDAIVMRELEGRSYQEIADRLGASKGAVRQLLSRARAAVRERIGALVPGEPLIRWAMSTGNGAAGVRVGALTGGCALTIKLCAAALLPATIVGVIAAPSRPRTAAAASPPRLSPRSAGRRDLVAAGGSIRIAAPPDRVSTAGRLLASREGGSGAGLASPRASAVGPSVRPRPRQLMQLSSSRPSSWSSNQRQPSAGAERLSGPQRSSGTWRQPTQAAGLRNRAASSSPAQSTILSAQLAVNSSRSTASGQPRGQPMPTNSVELQSQQRGARP